VGRPDTYLNLFPFMRADRIEAPLMLINGENDDNPVTPHAKRALLRFAGGAVKDLLKPEASAEDEIALRGVRHAIASWDLKPRQERR